MSNVKLSDDEIKCVEKIDEFIENRDVKKLQWLNVRDKVVDRVYLDAKSKKTKSGKKTREAFITEYEEIYQKSENSILRTAFGKKWSKKFSYDADASFYANYVYWKTNFPSEECPIIHMKSGKRCYPYLYIICSNNEMKYRGDTMNSWSTTLNEFIRRYGDEYFNNLEQRGEKWIYRRDGEGACKSWEEFLSKDSNYKKPLPEYIREFIDVVYTIGNFIPVPQEPINFNMQRSAFTNDYWDLTLLAIYEYYIGQSEYISLLRFLLGGEKIENWLKQFGNGEDGWNQFVKKNFMQSFVKEIGANEYGRPYELWDNHFAGDVLPKEKKQFEQFFEKAKKMIVARGTYIAEEIVRINEVHYENRK